GRWAFGSSRRFGRQLRCGQVSAMVAFHEKKRLNVRSAAEAAELQGRVVQGCAEGQGYDEAVGHAGGEDAGEYGDDEASAVAGDVADEEAEGEAFEEEDDAEDGEGEDLDDLVE